MSTQTTVVILAVLAAAISASASVADSVRLADGTVVETEIRGILNLSEAATESLWRGGALLPITLNGHDDLLQLRLHSSRAPSYRLLVQDESGEVRDVQPGPVRTVRGALASAPDAVVTGSILDEGLSLLIYMPDGGAHYRLEPLGEQAIDLATRHVVFEDTTVLEHPLTCGSKTPVGLPKRAPLPTIEHNTNAGWARGNAAGGGSPGCITELAVDTDVEYFESFGSVEAVEAEINDVTNSINIQYENQIGITHQITAIIVRTAEPDPYETTYGPDMPDEVKAEWQGNYPEIPRDIVMLYSDKETGAFAGEAMAIGVVCSSWSYCSTTKLSPFCQRFVVAHEIGHLWGAEHCDCLYHTMHPSVCANNFSAETVANLQFYLTFYYCLDDCPDVPPGSPSNDNCVDALTVTEGEWSFHNWNSTTEDPNLPDECDKGNGATVKFDVWYRYTPPGAGDLVVRLCESWFDSRVVIYADDDEANCPGTLLTCEDNFCGDGGLGGQVELAVAAGEPLLIRIGGDVVGNYPQGSGVMEIDLTTSCAGDIVNDGIIDGQDLLVLLGSWGACDGDCPADLDGDGVVSGADLLELLGGWGPCDG